MYLDTGTDHFIQVNGKRLHYRQWLHQAESTIIFLHGAIANEVWWRTVAAQLKKGDIYALDLLGHGQSDWSEYYTLTLHAENVIALIKRLKLKPPYHIIGHSYGGAVAALAAASLSDINVVLVDTPMYLLFSESEPSVRRYMKPVYATQADAVARFKPIPNQPVQNEELLQGIASSSLKAVAGGWTWQFDPEFHRRRVSRREQELVRQHCIGAKYWYGEYSPFATMEGLRLAQDLGLELDYIPDAYHAIPIDQPKILVDKINALL